MEYVVILGYFAILLGIGVVASRRVHDLSDYYVGGKKLGYWVVAFSARASGESAWLYIGLTGMGALVGARALWVVLGELIGVAICWFFMARPFKAAATSIFPRSAPSASATSRRTSRNRWPAGSNG